MRTSQLAKRAPVELLTEVSDLGFGWRDIARMLGVSVPALRRWRRGDPPTGAHRRYLAQLAAFVQILSEDLHVADPASWMEMPIARDVPLTAIDLYSGGNPLTVLELASDHISVEQALDEADPSWRQRYESAFEVYGAGVGQPAIRPRSTGR